MKRLRALPAPDSGAVSDGSGGDWVLFLVMVSPPFQRPMCSDKRRCKACGGELRDTPG